MQPKGPTKVNEESIYLGVSKEYGNTWYRKHEWDCGWYWGFGYLGNRDCHWHIDSIINHPKEYNSNWTNVTHHFTTTWLSQKQWWILRDLFLNAYALKKAAECYRCGGHQTPDAGPYRVINAEMAEKLNADLKTILDNIWNALKQWEKEHKDKLTDIVNLEQEKQQQQQPEVKQPPEPQQQKSDQMVWTTFDDAYYEDREQWIGKWPKS
jgi:ElaB/YqjD/DUF883 family membrane-anchored ribosome-binding protein